MIQERPHIERLELAGFKSIRESVIDFTGLNVLIGSNGAGKSNLVSLFALLRASFDRRLEAYVGGNGGPNALLHLGVKHTSQIEVTLTISTAKGRGIFYQLLSFQPPDGFFSHTNLSSDLESAELLRENAKLEHFTVNRNEWSKHLGEKLRDWPSKSMAVYHLADSSFTSAIRTEGYIQDNQRLNPDGRNLAAILYLYKTTHSSIYNRIRSTIRKIVPSFDDFVLQPQRFNANNILLNWRQAGSDYLLGPHQISDGTLRAMALVTLLLQPTDDLPDLLIIDEPELGLHPHAIAIIAGLIRAASAHVQVIVTTQSIEFLDQFEAGEVIVVDSADGASQFRRLDPSELKEWLEDYSVGELWRKNVIGGGPMP